MFNFEIDLVDIFKKNLNSLFDIKVYKEEVPFFSRNIDLVIVDNENNFISIEFKLNDIQGVLAQSLKCLLCSDFVYVCLPKRNLRKKTIEEFEKNGIGIILVDKDITIFKKAKKSQKNYLKNRLKVYLWVSLNILLGMEQMLKKSIF